ncbi:MAG: molybdopterin-dependent oxidoreductase [Bacteroidetes bacterium]|nr:molybdopterin-dependent oxidoreductase [Bacteroidota bacterium]
MAKSWIERAAEALRLIPRLERNGEPLPRLEPGSGLRRYPPMERWDEWEEYDPKAWPRRLRRRYMIVPTICFNCEAGCGLLAYIDKDTGQVRKLEGNPYHPGSRGRNCAKGPATINQLTDPDRILYPLRRKGPRGSGQWERVSWEEALEDIAGRIRRALSEGRNNEVVYHVGRPGHEGYMERVLAAWNVDGHNSHTNICSSGARFGYAIWQGYDRPSPDHANARFILLLSSHLETGHYFNPHAQRIIEGKMRGAKLAVMDPRLSNTASLADYWLPTYPGSEAAVLLSMARILLIEGRYDREFLEHWVNWHDYLRARHPNRPRTFEAFIEALIEEYAAFTPEFAAREAEIEPELIIAVAREIGEAGSRFATHIWRSSSSGNLGGWATARALHFLNVLTGSVGTYGGTSPSAWNKFKPTVPNVPPATRFWNELHFPLEYPLAHYEMSFLLPHFLKEGRGRLEVYFTRVFNPVWTYPDGFSWIEALRDESKIGLHVALTPTWNETAYWADYVLPMGHASERHDIVSYETHSGIWIGFRQPVLREALRRQGRPVRYTYEANPGEVWEEDEFWIELSWRIDPDGHLGIRRHFESPYRAGEKMTIEEYYRYIFEHVPGLPEAAAREGLDPLEYMRRYGAFEVKRQVYQKHLDPIPEELAQRAEIDPETHIAYVRGSDGEREAVGVWYKGQIRVGFPTPTRKQEFYSQTMVDWGWSEYAIPVYIKSHVHRDRINRERGEFLLLPTFRLPTLIHTRSGNAKYLVELSHRNPIWIHTSDAARLGLRTGDLVRVTTEIGYFVDRVWVTEAVKPGIVACSHHIGRWRREQDPPGNRWATNTVRIEELGPGQWRMRVAQGIEPFESADPDSKRIFWRDGGVHQNLTHAVHPDPISGMHCWHQWCRIEPARPEDRYGDVFVDTEKAFAIYKQWLALTRPGPGPHNLRRPLWLNRPFRPATEAFYVSSAEAELGPGGKGP